MTVEIPLTRGLVTIVDDEDAEWLMRWKWQARPSSHATYAVRGEKHEGKSLSLYLHRVLMSPPPGMVVDHVNRMTLDNRRCNLRICTPGQNQANSVGRKNTVTGVKGVFKDKGRNGYFSQIGVNGKHIRLGTFPTVEAAAEAYRQAALKYYGEFARA